MKSTLYQIHFNIRISISFDFFIRNIAQRFVVFPKPMQSLLIHLLPLFINEKLRHFLTLSCISSESRS